MVSWFWLWLKICVLLFPQPALSVTPKRPSSWLYRSSLKVFRFLAQLQSSTGLSVSTSINPNLPKGPYTCSMALLKQQKNYSHLLHSNFKLEKAQSNETAAVFSHNTNTTTPSRTDILIKCELSAHRAIQSIKDARFSWTATEK